MLYSFDLTIPANTPASAPVEAQVELVPGTVHHVELQFPEGCAGLVHVRVFHASHQVWPSNPLGTIASDGFLIGWNEAWDLHDKPYLLTLQGYNLDDTFPHTVSFRFALAELAGATPAPDELKLAGVSIAFLEVP